MAMGSGDTLRWASTAMSWKIYYHFFTRGNPWWVKNYKWVTEIVLFEPYYARSSSIKPSCSKTELKRCTTTEIRWNRNKAARTSPVVSTNRQLPNSFKNWGASLLIGPWDSTAIRTNSPLMTRWSSILNHLVRCHQFGCSACLARWSFYYNCYSGADPRGGVPGARPPITGREKIKYYLLNKILIGWTRNNEQVLSLQ